ncbi:hypothetical protein VCRA2122O12_70106 [Vibrio crassostreae]|nr:hypothetical protein VCRA2114E5_100070 [Vibrio crassostreae]CAK1960210.1 hypothetical protein VCRA2110O1_20070 [Vibrio crassostreae]CAK2171118.1 hypothetical protein VCRA2110O4_80105 [Vibrio crassostreae]CAK2199341.1 hypothetical protein VCRA2117O328_90155 [Vibrio crassostreae]CAK2361473.1 hypothetical protein VCRA2110O318_80156 [Vibrio crassostreae]
MVKKTSGNRLIIKVTLSIDGQFLLGGTSLWEWLSWIIDKIIR